MCSLLFKHTPPSCRFHSQHAESAWRQRAWVVPGVPNKTGFSPTACCTYAHTTLNPHLPGASFSGSPADLKCSSLPPFYRPPVFILANTDVTVAEETFRWQLGVLEEVWGGFASFILRRVSCRGCCLQHSLCTNTTLCWPAQ